MNLVDYTFRAYEDLLDAAINAGYVVLPVVDYLRADELPERYLVLRHDVDRKVGTAVAMATREATRGIRATYYFRTNTFDPVTVKQLADHDHEVGYHYEDLAQTHGDVQAARQRFAHNLNRFGEYVTVETVCAHGSPLSPVTNTKLWDNLPSEHGLMGEAYRSIDVGADSQDGLRYLSDTGRTWRTSGGIKDVETTGDLIAALESEEYPHIYLLAHPCRWARNRAELTERLVWDLGAETAKTATGWFHAARARIFEQN